MKTILFLLLAACVPALAQLQPKKTVSVTLAWDRSPDPTVTGYKVYYGVAHSVYTNLVDAGNATQCVVSNLLNCTTFFFAATAYNAAGLESDFSVEISYSVPCAPTNPPVLLRIDTNGIAGLTLPYTLHTVERSSALPVWTDIGVALAGADGSFLFVDLAPPYWRAFYRTVN